MFYWTILIVVLMVVLLAKVQLNRSVTLLLDRVKNKKRIHLEDLHTWMFPKSFLSLLAKINQLLHDQEAYELSSKGSREQVQTTLSSIREAVLVIDRDHRIVLFNDAAREIFRLADQAIGRRVEAIISRSRVTSVVQETIRGGSAAKEEVDIQQFGKTLWFEMSATRIPHLQQEGEYLVLMVLHDITKIKELEYMRKEFVANVSHELRTPITVIKGFAESLVEDIDTIDPETRLKFLNKIYKNSQRLDDLVKDLLALSRLESGDEQFQQDTATLQSIIEEIYGNHEARLAEQNIKWVIDMDQNAGQMLFHIVRVGQIFENLIQNALRYAKGLSQIEITVISIGKLVKISFSDDGCGIPPEAIPHLFERFYRVDKSRARVSGGTGLGLSIVKHIVQSYRGEITASSKEGEGTTIEFTLSPPSLAKSK